MRAPALRIRDRVTPALKALPGAVEVDGQSFPLRKSAAMAVLAAWEGLRVYDWLVVTQRGARALRGVLAPFAGLAPLPPLV